MWHVPQFCCCSRKPDRSHVHRSYWEARRNVLVAAILEAAAKRFAAGKSPERAQWNTVSTESESRKCEPQLTASSLTKLMVAELTRSLAHFNAFSYTKELASFIICWFIRYCRLSTDVTSGLSSLLNRLSLNPRRLKRADVKIGARKQTASLYKAIN